MAQARAGASLREAVRSLSQAPAGAREDAIDTWGLRVVTVLEDAHARAAYLGRFRAGDTNPPDEDDREFARRVIRDEDGFLARFEDDLRAGRYTNPDGTLKTDAIAARTKLYLNRVWGTANEAWALATIGPIRWEIDSTAENCEDCLRHAANSPYYWNTLPAAPRDGSTQCLTGCRCLLINSTGSTSFD